MITGIYFLLLLVLSAEDIRTRTASKYPVAAVYVLGLIRTFINKDDRWVTLTLTCVCFVLLYLLYVWVKQMVKNGKRELSFGGADVRLIPGMMLVQGWDVALVGIFFGLLAALMWHVIKKVKEREIPLVPWMSAGCFLAELIYLFS